MADSVATTVTSRTLAALESLPCVVGSRGWCAAAAGIVEATAVKPGNVHPGASFPDLAYDDLVAAAVAIAPAIDRAAATPVGHTILAAVEAARAATDTNANFGIILVTTPLAAVPDGEPLDAAAVERVLARLDAGDAAAIWRAIARARPGGMGRVATDDVAGPPPDDIRAAMRSAAGRDWIAALWAHGFEPLFAGPVADLAAAVDAGLPLLDAVVDCHVRQLARAPDSLIVRRHGAGIAALVSAAAAGIPPAGDPGRPAALARFDRMLRIPTRRNPGTTADLVAAALYILFRTGRVCPPRFSAA